MKWTDKLPTKPGAYWWKQFANSPSNDWELCTVRWSHPDGSGGMLFAMLAGDVEPYHREELGGWWAGPLPEPEDTDANKP